MANKTAVIMGAGPAGLTAAFELLNRTQIKPIIFEQSSDIGGLSKTVNYKGYRMDIGGHRFFSKSDRVMNWWNDFFPIQNAPSKFDLVSDNGFPFKRSRIKKAVNPDKMDDLMLVRKRLSRIYFLKKFFEYPVTLSKNTLMNLGIYRVFKIGFSYLWVKFFPIKKEKSLEDFFINRFGKELYLTFFKDYTEKLWGVKCSRIKPEWGAQRVKGMSVTKTLIHAIRSVIKKEDSIHQKKVETSLIEQFMYPKYGPGHFWESVAKQIEAKGGKIYFGHRAVGTRHAGNKIVSVLVESDKVFEVNADYVFSSIPIKEFVAGMNPAPPSTVAKVAKGLVYRDFITVGLLLKKLRIKNKTKIRTVTADLIPDNWMYIQDRDVKLGRVQVFNNWSPYMVVDKKLVWLGLEYFCSVGDSLWSMPDDKFKKFAVKELAKIGLIKEEDVLDSTIVRMRNTYPAYFGTYNRFDTVKKYVNNFGNLFLIGRNGMHKYNNQDHSMLTAMKAVDNILEGIVDKTNIWEVNTEKEYHESK